MNTLTSPILVGIDLAKDDFTVAVSQGNTEVLGSFSLNAEGLSDFQRFLDGFGAFPEDLVFGLEASGPYTDLLLSWLVAHRARVFLLNPLQIWRFRRAQSLRKTKTDAIDAATIVRYMAQAPQSLHEVQGTDDLQVLAGEYENVAQQAARLKTQMRQHVHTLFPELSSSSRLFSLRVLHVLLKFPSAHAIAHAAPKALARAWSAASQRSGRGPSLTYHHLQEMALSSVGTHSAEREAVLRSKIRQLLQILEEKKTLCRELQITVRQTHPQEWKTLTSVPGLGPITVALFLAQVRSLDRFPGHKQLAAFAGIDPTTYQSGQYSAPGHISKRGSPHLRRVLYLMAQSVIRYSNTFRQYFDRLTGRGKAYRVAVIACANKLLRVIFALVRNGTPFTDTPAEAISHS
jgi:transposase